MAAASLATLSVSIGAAVAFQWSIGPVVAELMLLVAALTTLSVLARRMLVNLRRHGRWTHLGSAILASGVLVAVVLPGTALLAGERQSRVVQLGLHIPDLDRSLARAYVLFLLALCAFAVGEALVLKVRPPVDAHRQERIDGPLVYGVLLLIGLLTRVSDVGPSTQEALAQRGQVQGQGLLALAYWSVPLALAIAILNRHWRSRWLVLVSVTVFVYSVVFSGVRSPLVLIGIAVLIRLIVDGAKNQRLLRAGLLVAMTVYVGAVMAIAVSAWRGEVSRGHQVSLPAEIARGPANPFDKLAGRASLDTLDGLTLALQVDREAVGASWLDPSKVLTGFVPRKFWPEKPDWLGSTVSKHYFGFGGHAGIFLSGPGYAYIVFGGAAGVAFVFLGLGMLAAAIYARIAPLSTEAVLLSYFLLRFFFGGDAFDAFHVLGLLLVLVAARGAAHVVMSLGGSRTAVTAPGLEAGPGS